MFFAIHWKQFNQYLILLFCVTVGFAGLRNLRAINSTRSAYPIPVHLLIPAFPFHQCKQKRRGVVLSIAVGRREEQGSECSIRLFAAFPISHTCGAGWQGWYALLMVLQAWHLLFIYLRRLFKENHSRDHRTSTAVCKTCKNIDAHPLAPWRGVVQLRERVRAWENCMREKTSMSVCCRACRTVFNGAT